MPQHRVTLTQDFWMGLFPLTYQQASILNRGDCGRTGTYTVYQKASSPAAKLSLQMLIGWGGSDDPSWFASPTPRAGSLLDNLGKRIVSGVLPEGAHFGLPTEAQWEYVCRAGTTTAYNNGTDSIAGVGPETATTKPMCPVGSYNPNAWGFYDFHGCIWQWTIEDFDAQIGTSPVTDPYARLSPSKLWSTLRGGSYNQGPVSNFRSGSRYYRSYNDCNDYNGARLVIVKNP